MSKRLFQQINPLSVNKGDRYIVLLPCNYQKEQFNQWDYVFATGIVYFNKAEAIVQVSKTEITDTEEQENVFWLPYENLVKEVHQ